jgi:1,4-alpha-glucan branching enzyme
MVICENDCRHTFRVYLPEAAAVELVGTFTDWRTRPVRMTREHTGWWSATLEMAPGDHDFSYLVNGSHWLADYAASGVKRNAFGGWVSQIHVAHEASQALPVRFPARTTKVAA